MAEINEVTLGIEESLWEKVNPILDEYVLVFWKMTIANAKNEGELADAYSKVAFQLERKLEKLIIDHKPQ